MTTKYLDFRLQCPNCGSTKVYRTDEEFVQCQECGFHTDWFEAREQFENHPDIRKPESGETNEDKASSS